MKSNKTIPTLAVALLLSAPSWAQQTQPQLPQQTGGAAMPVQPISPQPSMGTEGAIPAARGLFVGSPQNDNGTIQMGPDDSLLSGVESFSLGKLHSFTTLFDPSAFVTESTDNGLAPGQLDTATSLGGSLSYMRDWKSTQITAYYSGAVSFYRPDYLSDSSYHDLSIGQTIHAGRWGFVLHDDLVYTPGSNFGGFETGGIAPAGGVVAGSPIQSTLAPAETISTGFVDTLNNNFVAQASYSLSRRTAITFSGGYGILHFMAPGYIDSSSVSAMAGYNYALSRNNSIAVVYSYSQSIFNRSDVKANGQSLQASFGRRINGKLAVKLAGGPQFIDSQYSVGTQSASRLFWEADGAVIYGPKPNRVTYSASYVHDYTSGSGVFFGTDSDEVTGSVRMGFLRAWSGAISVGYGSNRSIVANVLYADRFDNWFAGANLSHSLGSELSFSLGTQYSYQISNGACPVLSCGVSPSREQVFFRLQWHPWPARIQ